MKDREFVNYFVDYLRENGYPGLQVDRYPEDDNDGDIDAIAGPFAIEHTSFDPLPNQRQDADWFMRAAGGLENELSKPPFQLNITLEYSAVTKGQNWSSIREAIKDWIIKNSPELPCGRHVLDKVPGVPFRLYVTKERDRLSGIFFARRDAPKDDDLSDRIRQQFESKTKKLFKYQEPGTTKILLVERYSIALMSGLDLYNAIKYAYPEGPPPGVGEIWIADTSIPSCTIETTTPIEFLNIYKEGKYNSYINELQRRPKLAATN
jgi:hypothetical protein